MSAMSVPGTIVHETDGNLILARRDREVEPLAGRGPLDRDGHLRAFVATDLLDELVRGQPDRALPVDRDDDVARLESGRLGRTARDDRHDDRLPVLLAEQHADADDVLIERVLLGLRLLGRQKDGVARVSEGLDHAADRAVRERPRIDDQRDRRSSSGSTSSASQKRPKSPGALGDAMELAPGSPAGAGVATMARATCGSRAPENSARADRDADDEHDDQQYQRGDRARRPGRRGRRRAGRFKAACGSGDRDALVRRRLVVSRDEVAQECSFIAE